MRSLCWRHSCKYQGTRATDKEPFPVQFGDVITSSPAAQKSSCLFLLLLGIITSCFVHSSPSEVFCCLASPLAIKHVPFGLFSRWLSSWMQHPKVHPPSQIESYVFGFFLLGVSTLHYFFLLNSTRFSRVSWFHTQTFCFQETAMILSAMRPGTQPNTSKQGSWSVKRDIPCRKGPPCHHSWQW